MDGSERDALRNLRQIGVCPNCGLRIAPGTAVIREGGSFCSLDCVASYYQAEFDERGPIPKGELWSRLSTIVAEASAAMARPDEQEWQRVRRIQGFEVTGLGAALHSVAHFRGHTQEIIHQTREILGEKYQYAGPR